MFITWGIEASTWFLLKQITNSCTEREDRPLNVKAFNNKYYWQIDRHHSLFYAILEVGFRLGLIVMIEIHRLKKRKCFWSKVSREAMSEGTRPDTRYKMRLVCVLITFENNTGRTDGRTYGTTDRRTDGRTDTTSYRDATAHLKRSRLTCS